jgi:hypothetical protein
VQNRLTISEAGSTSSSGIGFPVLNFKQPAEVAIAVGLLVDQVGKPLVGVLVAGAGRAWISAIVCGFQACFSPVFRQWNCPWLGSTGSRCLDRARDSRSRAGASFFAEHVETHAFDPAGRAAEGRVDHFLY